MPRYLRCLEPALFAELLHHHQVHHIVNLLLDRVKTYKRINLIKYIPHIFLGLITLSRKQCLILYLNLLAKGHLLTGVINRAV